MDTALIALLSATVALTLFAIIQDQVFAILKSSSPNSMFLQGLLKMSSWNLELWNCVGLERECKMLS